MGTHPHMLATYCVLASVVAFASSTPQIAKTTSTCWRAVVIECLYSTYVTTNSILRFGLALAQSYLTGFTGCVTRLVARLGVRRLLLGTDYADVCLVLPVPAFRTIRWLLRIEYLSSHTVLPGFIRVNT
jgi:hypothetical protein